MSFVNPKKKYFLLTFSEKLSNEERGCSGLTKVAHLERPHPQYSFCPYHLHWTLVQVNVQRELHFTCTFAFLFSANQIEQLSRTLQVLHSHQYLILLPCWCSRWCSLQRMSRYKMNKTVRLMGTINDMKSVNTNPLFHT
jgi:hypothetical protein